MVDPNCLHTGRTWDLRNATMADSGGKRPNMLLQDEHGTLWVNEVRYCRDCGAIGVRKMRHLGFDWTKPGR